MKKEVVEKLEIIDLIMIYLETNTTTDFSVFIGGFLKIFFKTPKTFYWVIEGGEEGQPQQFLVRATLLIFSSEPPLNPSPILFFKSV